MFMAILTFEGVAWRVVLRCIQVILCFSSFSTIVFFLSLLLNYCRLQAAWCMIPRALYGRGIAFFFLLLSFRLIFHHVMWSTHETLRTIPTTFQRSFSLLIACRFNFHDSTTRFLNKHFYRIWTTEQNKTSWIEQWGSKGIHIVFAC